MCSNPTKSFNDSETDLTNSEFNKLNKLGFLSELGEYLGVKDMRTISKYFDVNGRKELALKLAEYANSENIC